MTIYEFQFDRIEPCPKVEEGFFYKHIPKSAPDTAESWDDLFTDIDTVIMKGVQNLAFKSILRLL